MAIIIIGTNYDQRILGGTIGYPIFGPTKMLGHGTVGHFSTIRRINPLGGPGTGDTKSWANVT